jgi:hypothetical protein
MEIKDWIMAIAIIIGPISAVQISVYLEQARLKYQRKVAIFKTLMTTRATPISLAHVEALNTIDLEFHEEKSVIDAWKKLLNHLCDTSTPQNEIWQNRRVDLHIALLKTMSDALNYRFDEETIRRACYYPQGQGDIESDAYLIRKFWVEIMAGNKPIPIVVKGIESQSGLKIQ